MSARCREPFHHGYRGLLGLCCVFSLAACKPEAGLSSIPEAEPGTSELTQGELGEPVAASVIVEPPPDTAVDVCRARTPQGAPALVPDSVKWLGHIAPREVMASQLWSVFEPTLRSEAEFTEFEQVFTTCGIALENIEHVLIGFDDETTGGTKGAVVITGPGVGLEDFGLCLATKLDELDEHGLGGITLEVLENDPSVKLIRLVDSHVYMFHRDVLVLVSQELAGDVEGLSRCSGFPATRHSLGPLVDRIDTHAPLWFGGLPPAESARSFESTLSLPEGSLHDFNSSMRLGGGLELFIRLGMRDAAAADTAAASISSFLPMLSGVGPPELQPAIETIVVESVGADVMVRANMSETILEQMRQHLP